MNFKKFYLQKKDTPDSGGKKAVKFLIIRFSSYGDIVLTTPVIRCLRHQYPHATIHYLTKRKFGSVLETNPHLDKIILLEGGVKKIIPELEKENYDYILDLHHNLLTLRIKNLLRDVPFYTFQKLGFKKWIYTKFKINLMPHKHVVDRYMATVAGLGVVNDGKGLDFFIPESEFIKKEDIPFSHIQGYIVIAIGAAYNTRKLPLEKLKELAGKIQFPIILIGEKEDAEDGEKIAEQDSIKIYNACGKFSLNELADIIRNAKLIVSHDNDMIPIAASFNKKILSVFGNTVPSFGMTPYQTSFEVFQVNGLSCRPCAVTGFVKCPKGHFKCMNNQSMDILADRVHSIVKGDG